MSEFKTGQWYIIGNDYYEYDEVRQTGLGDNLHWFRKAGELNGTPFGDPIAFPASLIPDFSDAKVGESCFDVELEHCEISEVRKYDIYTRLMVDDGKGNINPHIIYKDGYAHNPLLFNSFAQFQAYWAEKALERNK